MSEEILTDVQFLQGDPKKALFFMCKQPHGYVAVGVGMLVWPDHTARAVLAFRPVEGNVHGWTMVMDGDPMTYEDMKGHHWQTLHKFGER